MLSSFERWKSYSSEVKVNLLIVLFKNWMQWIFGWERTLNASRCTCFLRTETLVWTCFQTLIQLSLEFCWILLSILLLPFLVLKQASANIFKRWRISVISRPLKLVRKGWSNCFEISILKCASTLSFKLC